MMSNLRKYGVATTIIVPIRKASSQDFATSADWTPVVGDVKISKDGGNVANLATLPTAVGGSGAALWKFTLSVSEMQAAQIVIQIVDAAAKAVDDLAIIVDTYGDAAAQHAMDLDVDVANAVYDAARASHNAPGTFGEDANQKRAALVPKKIISDPVTGIVSYRNETDTADAFRTKTQQTGNTIELVDV